MGVADSPLRDRVLFVEGAPRSGTTFLVSLLSVHPEVAGLAAETHLFNAALKGLFDNHERTAEQGGALAAYLTREELVDIARDLVDQILERVRNEVGPQARFVVEKTPAPRQSPKRALSRKLECYPDAWHVHIVRDREAVTRSLMRARWNPDRSEAASRNWAQQATETVREVFGDHHRYREIRYEDLAADPVAAMSELFAWLGLDCGAGVRERIVALAQHRFAPAGPGVDGPEEDEQARGRATDPGAPTAATGEEAPDGGAGNRLRRIWPGHLAERIRTLLRARRGANVVGAFIEAFHKYDATRIERLTTDAVEFHFRGPEGDLEAAGEEGRRALLAAGRSLFAAPFMYEQWTVADGQPFSTALFTGFGHDARRVDLSMSVVVVGGRVSRVSLISTGALHGRPRAVGSSPPAG